MSGKRERRQSASRHCGLRGARLWAPEPEPADIRHGRQTASGTWAWWPGSPNPALGVLFVSPGSDPHIPVARVILTLDPIPISYAPCTRDSLAERAFKLRRVWATIRQRGFTRPWQPSSRFPPARAPMRRTPAPAATARTTPATHRPTPRRRRPGRGLRRPADPWPRRRLAAAIARARRRRVQASVCRWGGGGWATKSLGTAGGEARRRARDRRRSRRYR